MAVAVMLISFVLLYVAVFARKVKEPLATRWRSAFLMASVLWSTYLAVVTEVLSLCHLLRAPWVFALWLVLAVTLLGYVRWLLARHRPWGLRLGIGTVPASLIVLLGGVVSIVGISLSIAIAAPPNTPDTFSYHLARVVHWIENGSLSPYPTHFISQDFQPPWTEYVFLHLHLLTGGDVLDGTVQWFSFVGCILAVSLIAKQLGAARRGQTFAAVFAATIHMAIIQASSTQNDLVLAYWLACAVYFCTDGVTNLSAANVVGAGASLGLAALTKDVTYIYLFPFLLLFSTRAIRRWHWPACKPLAAIAVLALLLNLGFFARNIAWSGGPLGPVETTQAFRVSAFTPDVLLLNVVRNFAIQFSSPDQHANLLLNRLVSWALACLQLNLNDPRATLQGSPPFLLRGERGLWLSDGYTVNGLHLLLALFTGASCVFVSTLRRRRSLLMHVAALTSAFLLFSLYLRWQAGSNRLMLGLFVLSAPAVGAMMEVLCRADSRVAQRLLPGLVIVVHLVLLASSTPWVFYSQSRPLLGASSVLTTPRLDQYFAAYRPAEAAYVGATDFIRGRGCTQVGYYVSGPQDRFGYPEGAPNWEYPLWVLLDSADAGAGNVRIEHVAVTNVTASLAPPSTAAAFHPCAIFAILEPSVNSYQLVSGEHVYRRAWSDTAFVSASIVVFVPDDGGILVSCRLPRGSAPVSVSSSGGLWSSCASSWW